MLEDIEIFCAIARHIDPGRILFPHVFTPADMTLTLKRKQDLLKNQLAFYQSFYYNYDCK